MLIERILELLFLQNYIVQGEFLENVLVLYLFYFSDFYWEDGYIQLWLKLYIDGYSYVYIIVVIQQFYILYISIFIYINI